MKKALITGGAGFIGLNLSRHLSAKGIEVHLIDNFARGSDDADLAAVRARPGVSMQRLDLSTVGATDGLGDDFDAIFHFAAVLGVATVIARAYDTLTLNVSLTAEALRLARRQKRLKAFVFASTSEIYAGSLGAGLLKFPTPEDSVIALPSLAAPRTSYMLSKLYGEMMAQHAGVPSIVIRPHNVYGPRMGTEHVVPELMKRMRGAAPGSDIEIFSPTHRRTFCYIDDAIEMIVRIAANAQAVGQAWNVGTEKPEYEIREVAEVVKRVVGADVKLMPGAETAGSPTRRVPSMVRTDALTGLHTRVGLEEGIAKTYHWYAPTFV